MSAEKNQDQTASGGAGMRSQARLMAALALVAAVAVAGVVLGVVALGREPTASAAQDSTSTSTTHREFMFQVIGYKTENQGGQTMNMYFHYRYNNGIATKDIPNYLDLRKDALAFIDGVDAKANPYWETLTLELCTQLKDDYPVEGISCQLQIYPDKRPGLPYEPGYHTSITTLGNIDALAIPGPPSAPLDRPVS
jgi:hypothetical protein